MKKRKQLKSTSLFYLGKERLEIMQPCFRNYCSAEAVQIDYPLSQEWLIIVINATWYDAKCSVSGVKHSWLIPRD